MKNKFVLQCSLTPFVYEQILPCLQGFDIVSLVLQNGKLQVQDLLQQLESSSPSTRPLLTHLLLSKYLVEAFQIEHISPQDLRIAYFQEAAVGQKKPLSAKVAREFEGKVRERLVSEREMSSTQGCVERNGVDHVPVSGKKSSTSKRRKLTVEEEGAGGKSDRRKNKRRSDGSSDTDADRSDDAGALDRSKGRKRKKSLAPNEVNGKSAKPPSWRSQLPEVEQRRLDQLTADDNTYVRVNFDRFDVHIRNAVVHSLVSSSFNKSTADVYLALIQSGDTRTTESGGWPSMSTTRGASISLTQFATELDLGSVLSHGLDKSGFKMLGGVTKPTKYEFACEYVAILSRVDDVMALSSANENSSKGGSGAATQAQALSRPITYLVPGPGVSSSGVVTATGSRIPAAVSVDFASAGRKMKWNLLKSTVEKVFSSREARIIGVLRREGKLEEKHISKLALLSLGDTREACSRLFSCSIISLQEVPKSSDRNPQRTFFLYFLDYSRALAWLSDHIYKTHSRISQRRAFEQQREETLLAKTARTDVQLEGIENVLGQSERIRLEQCRSKLALLTVEEQRVERESWILSKMVS